MKKAIASILAVVTVLFCFAGCNKYKEATEVAIRDGQTRYIVTDKDGGLATDQNGNFVEEYTDDYGKVHTQAIMLNTALVFGKSIYFTDFNITLPDGWSNNENNSSYTQANIVDPDGNLITVRESDRTAAECDNANGLIINQVKKTYSDAEIVGSTVEISGETCKFRSFYIPDAPEGTNPYTAYIIIEHGGIVLDVSIESADNLTGKLDSIIDVLSTINYNKKAVETTTNTTAPAILTTTK